MTEDAVRDEIAFIRRAIEEGRGYASGRSPDMVVWGGAIALASACTYAAQRGWPLVGQGWLWGACVGLPWLYSLRGLMRPGRPPGRPMARAMGMLWLGCGVSLTVLAVVAAWSGDMREGWFTAVSAGTMGIAFFASAALSNLGWMRLVAVGWWVGEALLYVLRHRPEAMALHALLMLGLLALPGIILLRGGARPGAAAAA
jgi:hypothetical protein